MADLYKQKYLNLKNNSFADLANEMYFTITFCFDKKDEEKLDTYDLCIPT